MPTQHVQATRTGRWRAVGHLPLALCAAVALRQSIRTRRALAEAAPPGPHALPDPPPRVSIILPVRDEEENIDGVLASLLVQDSSTTGTGPPTSSNRTERR